MNEYVHSMGRTITSGIGILADEVEFSIAEYKKGIDRITDREKYNLLSAKVFLENILNFERMERKHNGMKVKGALPRLELLKASGSIVDAWVTSKIPFPKNDEEFEKELQRYIQTLENMAMKKSTMEVGEENVNNVEKLFFTLGEMALRKYHVSSLHSCF